VAGSAGWSGDARDHWKDSGETILGFAAHNRNWLFGQIAEASANDDGVLTISYEQLTEDPVSTLTNILDFANVASHGSLHRLVESRYIVNTNGRWRELRTPEEIALLDAVLGGVTQKERTS